MFDTLARLLGRVFPRRGGRPLSDRLLEAQRIAGLASWEWDPVSGDLWWSPEHYRLFGVAAGPFTPTYESYIGMVHPSDRALVEGRVAGAVAGTADYACDYRIVRPDGGVVWLHSRGDATRDAAGRLVRLAGVVQAITERKRTEAALREGEARLALTLQAAGAATWFLDLDGMRFMPSETAVQMHGRPAGTALDSAGVIACVHPEDRPRVQAALARTLTDGRPYRVEYRVAAGGGERWLASSGELHGQRLLGLLQDITDRKRAEAALRASEAMYRSVVDSLAEGIVVQDAAGRILTCNGRAEVILGQTCDQIAGRTSMDPRWRAVRADGSPFPGADHPAMVALRTGAPVFNTVMGVRKPDGGESWITVNAVPVREPAPPGAVAAVVCSFHDVTAARRMDEQLRASLREKEVMLREIHHRVKNNLAVTVGLFNFQMRTMPDGPAKAALRQAQDRVRTMALVHEMLHQAALLTELDLPGYVGQLVRHLAAGYSAGNRVAVTLDVAPVALPLEAAIPFGLILNELVSNAFKHAFPDDRAGALVISLRHAGNELILEVRDDGAGPPPGADPFAVKSTGLQLVRELAGQLDGRVEWERTGETVFRLTFPAGGGPGVRRR